MSTIESSVAVSRGEAAVRYVAEGVLPRDRAAERLIERLRRAHGVRRITALPDTFAANLEAPVSVVTEMQDWIVPAATTNVMNCGVGVVDTGLRAADVSDRDLAHLLCRLWDAGRSDDYRISAEEVERFFLEGVDALTRAGTLTPEDRDAFEFGGNVLSEGQARGVELDDVVPWLIRQLGETRAPARLQLRGNHFVEANVVEDVLEADRLERFGLEDGRLVLTLHMDHRITGGIHQHYVVRKKYLRKGLPKRLAYELSKLQFHFGYPGRWRQVPERLRLYFLERDYVGIPMDSEEGRRYRDAYAVCTNYGYAGRGMIYRMVRDVLRSEFGADLPARIVWDTNHESLRFRATSSGLAGIARKGAVECFPGRPAVVLGHYDMATLLGECVGSEATGYSYDHGSSHVRRSVKDPGDANGDRRVSRFVIPAGGGFEDARAETHPLKARAPMEVLSAVLEEHGAVDPVAWLRPLANLSQD